MSDMKDKKLTMIGNAHIDPVWLWNWQEGFHEVKATFRSALDRMNEDADFIFTCSSAAYYEWVEKNNPEMFCEIQKRVKEGRWEIVGGWWVQPDCNIPSGESFVRQGLYGQRYFLEKFGRMAETGYNVDSFGHNGSLPQILRKSGMKNYVFMRPGPHEKALPGRIFRWMSQDGSSVMAYRIPYSYGTEGKDLEKFTRRLMCELEGGEEHLMMFYGVGNHGGGPTKENIRSIHELAARSDTPDMKMGTVGDFFREIGESGGDYPEYVGDLQHHASGCYSVLSRVKKENRLAEQMLSAAEAFSSVAAVTDGQPYPDDFKEAWKGVLFNQFHDILAGTSIRSAYDDASYLYGQAMAVGQKNLNYALQAISWNIDIEKDVSMKPIVVFNSHPWSGKMIISVGGGPSSDLFRLTDNRGNVIPAQRVRSEVTIGNASRLLFAADLPSMGYRVFKLYRHLKEEETPVWQNVRADAASLENDSLRLEINPETGFIRSLYDKKNDLEILSREGGRLTVYEDKSDTWAHDVFKFEDDLGDMKVESVSLLEEGPVRSTIRVKYRYNDSYVTSDFSLYQDLEYVAVHVKVDWREPLTMLKVRYPVNVRYSRPTYEIPYGYIEKSATGEEEPGQSWFDLSGEHTDGVMYGLAIANDCKYSYCINKDEMRLTVLKNAVYAHHDPTKLKEGAQYDYVDEGVQEFNYILLPHAGGWKDSSVIKRAGELNFRPIPVIETYHKGKNPQEQSYLEIESDHVTIGAVKQAEDKDGIIIRAVETKKQAGDAVLKIPFMNRKARLSFAPCEIKTVKVPYDASLPVREVNLLELNF